MPKYAVLLEGRGCSITSKRAHWGLFGRKVLRQVGFYTTRFIEAQSPELAATTAVILVREQLKAYLVGQAPEEIVIDVEEATEDPRGFDERAPGTGFTWYTAEANEGGNAPPSGVEVH